MLWLPYICHKYHSGLLIYPQKATNQKYLRISDKSCLVRCPVWTGGCSATTSLLHFSTTCGFDDFLPCVNWYSLDDSSTVGSVHITDLCTSRYYSFVKGNMTQSFDLNFLFPQYGAMSYQICHYAV